MEENSDLLDSKMQFGQQEASTEKQKEGRSTTPVSVKRNPKHRVDDPIDEQEEIDNEIKKRLGMKKNKSHK